jgi:hypothetical protein
MNVHLTWGDEVLISTDTNTVDLIVRTGSNPGEVSVATEAFANQLNGFKRGDVGDNTFDECR